MKNVIMVTFWGKMFLFENNISPDQYILLQNLAESEKLFETVSPYETEKVLQIFLAAAEKNLNIILKQVDVSHIIRIK